LCRRREVDALTDGWISGAVRLIANENPALACGKERWPVKVGTNRDTAADRFAIVPIGRA
jgi:hypothetical protein